MISHTGAIIAAQHKHRPKDISFFLHQFIVIILFAVTLLKSTSQQSAAAAYPTSSFSGGRTCSKNDSDNDCSSSSEESGKHKKAKKSCYIVDQRARTELTDEDREIMRDKASNIYESQ